MARTPNVKARGRILETAFRLFHKNGYRGVSMDAVAAGAGIKKANLFHYYPTKVALAASVLDFASGCLKAQTLRTFGACGDDPIAAVRRLFGENEAGMKKSRCCRGCFVGNLAQELSDQNEALRAKIAEYFDFWTGQLAALLERARARGFFRRGMDAGRCAQAILALLQGATLLCKAQKRTRCMRDAGAMAVAYLEVLRAGNSKAAAKAFPRPARERGHGFTARNEPAQKWR